MRRGAGFYKWFRRWFRRWFGIRRWFRDVVQ